MTVSSQHAIPQGLNDAVTTFLNNFSKVLKITIKSQDNLCQRIAIAVLKAINTYGQCLLPTRVKHDPERRNQPVTMTIIPAEELKENNLPLIVCLHLHKKKQQNSNAEPSTQIGQGTFKTVYKTFIIRSDTWEWKYLAELITKSTSISSRICQDTYLAESFPQSSYLDIPFISFPYFSSKKKQDKICILSELATADLSNFLSNNFITVDEKNNIAKQMFLAVLDLHTSGFIHKDIKPENFLVFVQEDSLVVKLSDLDTIEHLGTKTHTDCFSIAGSREYLPQKILDQIYNRGTSNQYGYNSDIYALIESVKMLYFFSKLFEKEISLATMSKNHLLYRQAKFLQSINIEEHTAQDSLQTIYNKFLIECCSNPSATFVSNDTCEPPLFFGEERSFPPRRYTLP